MAFRETLMHPTVAPTDVFECPSLDRLMGFELGKLSEPESISLADHISSCERCENALYELQVSRESEDDRLIACIKRCFAGPNQDEWAGIGASGMAETLLLSPSRRGGVSPIRGLWNLPPAPPGELPKLDKYKLLEEIGDGGMGIVYRAKHLALGWTVAVKMIAAKRCTTRKSIDRFVREGKTLARLEHPNIVKIVDFDFQDGFPYFAMELMEGGNLDTKLSGGPLEPREAAELVRTLARTVEYMHDRGVVHRDLKPSNILLDLDGTPKISDFGLAKLFDSDSDEPQAPRLTEPGTLLGTVNYMAPECIFAGPQDVGPTIDIYALGAILYELLTGKPPFSAPSKLQLIEIIRTKQVVPPSRIRPGLPPWLEEVCLKCLEKSRTLRYATAGELAEDLDRWLAQDAPPPPVTIRRASRIWRNIRRPSAIAAACSAPILFLALGIGRNDPDRALKQIQADLARGQAVTLIGETGLPKWYRWDAGEAYAKLTDEVNGTTNIQSWETALLEIVHDPGSDRYRITAQIRHEMSSTAGEVGLYFAHTKYPEKSPGSQLSLHVAFNAVSGDAELRARIPMEHKPMVPTRQNVVSLRPHLLCLSAGEPNFDTNLSPILGPRFKPLGEDNGRWHDLEILVTPEKLSVVWNGEFFSTAVTDLQERVDRDLREESPSRKHKVATAFRTRIDLRGSLGLYVRNGKASFRSLTIEPLSSSRRVHIAPKCGKDPISVSRVGPQIPCHNTKPI